MLSDGNKSDQRDRPNCCEKRWRFLSLSTTSPESPEATQRAVCSWPHPAAVWSITDGSSILQKELRVQKPRTQGGRWHSPLPAPSCCLVLPCKGEKQENICSVTADVSCVKSHPSRREGGCHAPVSGRRSWESPGMCSSTATGCQHPPGTGTCSSHSPLLVNLVISFTCLNYP